MPLVDPQSIFRGTVMVAAPHMDDEALACSGTIACLPHKDLIYLVYATDGRKSPAPLLTWQGSPPPELSTIRMQEAREAMAVLGIPEKNLHFLGLPESDLKHNQAQLKQALIADPGHKTDCASSHSGMTATRSSGLKSCYPPRLDDENIDGDFRILHLQPLQAFIRWDIRKFIQADSLLEVEIRPFTDLKKRAINCYISQTTKFYSWQDRPILKSERIEELAKAPEIFLRYDPDRPGAAIFARSAFWIRFVHRFEQFIKIKKEQALSVLRLGVHQKKWKRELS
jgi:LmbE family N-acetylglucosaminyl deacetylase